MTFPVNAGLELLACCFFSSSKTGSTALAFCSLHDEKDDHDDNKMSEIGL